LTRNKRATCYNKSGGTRCRKRCQKIKHIKKKKYYCTGSCEWSWVGLVCRCKDPTC
uniref:Toxin n=1 Tax=Meloidogyne hapla TaxID=6305 RepID=A0A1I8BTI6_MELHA